MDFLFFQISELPFRFAMSAEEINAIWPELHPDGKRYEIVLKEVKPRQPSISDEDVQKLTFKEVRLLRCCRENLNKYTKEK